MERVHWDDHRGSLVLTGFEGLELRLQVSEETKNVVSAMMIKGDSALEVAAFAEAEIERREDLELVGERHLTVVVFRRRGWTAADYQVWSDRMLADEFAFVVPTTHDGETLARFAVVNPQTTTTDIAAILDTMV